MPNHCRPVRMICLLANALMLLIGFQNCSPTGFKHDGSSQIEVKGNGDNYSGKQYVHYLDRKICSDGGRDASVIVIDSEKGFLLIRNSCLELNPPVKIPAGQVDLAADQTYIVYDNNVYVLDLNSDDANSGSGSDSDSNDPADDRSDGIEDRDGGHDTAGRNPESTPGQGSDSGSDPGEETGLVAMDECGGKRMRRGKIEFNSATGKYTVENKAFHLIEYSPATPTPLLEGRSVDSGRVTNLISDQPYVQHIGARIGTIRNVAHAYIKASLIREVDNVSHMYVGPLEGSGTIQSVRNVSHLTLYGEMRVEKLACVS
ncbi:MAG: hypothetical protein AB7P49_13250, partial [Bdellovibrionales bacterium]